MSAHFRAQGEILVGEGVDLLILETLGSTARTIKAMVSATGDLGVPVWVSISCARDRDTGAVMLGIEESREATHIAETYGPLAEAVREIVAAGGSAVLMMHSVRDVTEDAVKVMRANWSGPVGAYPNAGVLDTAELGLRRSGFAGRVPGRRQALGRGGSRDRGRLLRRGSPSTYAPSRKDWRVSRTRRDAGRVPSHV